MKNKGRRLNQTVYRIFEKVFSGHGIKLDCVYLEYHQIWNERIKGNYDALLFMSDILITDPWADLRLMFMSDLGARIPDPSGKIPSLIEKAEKTQDPSER